MPMDAGGGGAISACPLHPTADNPAPAGAEALWVMGAAGKRVRVVWIPADPAHGQAGPKGSGPRGTVTLSPGRIECAEKYFETVGDLRARGFAVVVIDWRGQGLSDRLASAPERGHLDRLDHCVTDLLAARAALGDRMTGPQILLCHSMGGAIGLHILLSGRAEFAAAAFSAPMWGIRNLPPGAFQLAATATALGFATAPAPGQALIWSPTAFEGNIFTHDPVRFARNERILVEHPALRLGGPSFGWVHEFLKAHRMMAAPGRIEALTIPAFIARAGQDALIDNAAIAAIARRWREADMLDLPDARHEILQETDDVRDAFWAGFDRLLARARI